MRFFSLEIWIIQLLCVPLHRRKIAANKANNRSKNVAQRYVFLFVFALCLLIFY